MTIVLDSSALPAWLNDEPSGERTEAVLSKATMLSVNWAEVVQELHAQGLEGEDIEAVWNELGVSAIAADRTLAQKVGLMRLVTSHAGLSLGDRFCLALARQLGAPALTADRQWARVAEDVGVEVELIR